MDLLSLKQTISGCAGRVVDLDQMIRKGRNRYILAYHRILPLDVVRHEYIQDSMWTTPDTLEAQIKWMLEIGEIVDITRILDFSLPNPRPLFSLTFDDGWRDNYDHALPLLKKYGLSSSIFVVTGAIESAQLFWPDECLTKTHSCLRDRKIAPTSLMNYIHRGLSSPRNARDVWVSVNYYLEHLKTLTLYERRRALADYYRFITADPSPITGPVLDWNQLIEMRDSGVSIGSHTHTHAILETCDPPTILRELTMSRELLETRLQIRVSMFCYPNARYRRTYESLLQRAGYEFAFTMDNKVVPPDYLSYFIPRIAINEQTCAEPSYFKFRLLGIPKY